MFHQFSSPPPPYMFHQFAKQLWRFILILMYLFCKAISMLFFMNSLDNSRNFLHYQWPEEFTKKQKKPASKWHQIALYERLMSFFCSNYRIILKSIVLLLRHCKRKWSQSYLNAKNRYLGMTWVTKKLHESIAKLNNEFNNSKKKVWGVVKSPILMIRVAGIIIAGISKDCHKSRTKIILYSSNFGFCRVLSPGLVPRQLGDETAVWC